MKIDMSPHSITMRLKKTSELRRLCIALGGDRLKERLQKINVRTSALRRFSTRRETAS
jgi:hypothetical protein